MRRLLLPLLLAVTLTLICGRAPAVTAAAPAAAPAGALALRVAQAGVVTLEAEALAGAGWPLDLVDANGIRLGRRGVELPLQLNDGGDGRLDPGDSLQFVAAAGDSPFTAEAVYWLWYGAGPGLRAPLQATPAAPLAWERDTLYRADARTPRGDGWFAAELRSGGTPLTLTLDLPAPAPAGSPLDLAVTPLLRRAGHRLTVHAAGRDLGAIAWDSGGPTAPLTVTLQLPALPPGPLALELALVSAGDPEDVVLIDGIALPRLLTPLPDLPTPTPQPVLARDFTAGPAPGQHGADVLIIAHGSLIAALEPLLAAKQARGLVVAVLDVQSAYDTFSYGERDPAAIRALIQTAARHWQPRPRSVLLAGAGSVRMRVAPGEADPTLIPPFLVSADPKYGEIACDTCFTRLDGASPLADPLPDIPIGRLPARTAAEMAALAAKIAGALQAPPPGTWRARALLLADNDVEADGTPDRVGHFAETAAEAAALLPPGLRPALFRYAPGPDAEPSSYRNPDVLRAALLPALDAGAALLIYSGHASPWQYAATAPGDATPYLLSLYDAEGRANGGRLPILISLSCLSGNWANPTMPTIDESLLLHPGGVAASLSPGGSATSAGHRRLLAGLLPPLAEGSTLGQAHLAGLAALIAAGRDLDMAYSYGILGDPDLALPPREDGAVFLPLVRR